MRLFSLTGDINDLMNVVFWVILIFALFSTGIVHFILPKRFRRWYTYLATFSIMILLACFLIYIAFRL